MIELKLLCFLGSAGLTRHLRRRSSLPGRALSKADEVNALVDQVEAKDLIERQILVVFPCNGSSTAGVHHILCSRIVLPPQATYASQLVRGSLFTVELQELHHAGALQGF